MPWSTGFVFEAAFDGRIVRPLKSVVDIEKTWQQKVKLDFSILSLFILDV